MAQSYTQLQKKIQALQLRAEKLRQDEMQGVIDRIKTAIAHYGLTPDHLFGSAGRRKPNRSPLTNAKYSDGQGNTWSGKGKRPNWLREAIASGRGLDEFASSAATATNTKAPRAAKATKAAKPKRATRVRFRDSAGHTWSGMGPRPQWLKDAVASGQTEESLRV